MMMVMKGAMIDVGLKQKQFGKGVVKKAMVLAAPFYSSVSKTANERL